MQIIDFKLSILLTNEFNLIESPSDRQKKEFALLLLNHVLKDWMKIVHQSLGKTVDPNSMSNSAILLCYGSYKLGVSTPSGDIDTLVLAPKYVDRNEHFFGILHKLLEKKAKENENIKELTSINYEHSITPLIKMVFYDVSVDIVFASVEDVSSLNGEIKPSGLSIRSNLYNDSILISAKMDEKMQRSYNGFRNAEMILNSMFSESEKKNDQLVERRIHNFRMCLRCLKLIAKHNGINENKFGYLGGIAFALMMTKIVQLFPNYSFSHLLEKFFYIYGNLWDFNNWPILIVDEVKEPNQIASNGYPRSSTSETSVILDYNWNEDKQKKYNFAFMSQKSISKRFMNIVTPAWPQMNSSFNVCLSTRSVIINLFKRKYDEMMFNKSQMLLKNEQFLIKSWQTFYKKFEFFRYYEQFIEIVIVCREDEAQFLKWKGFIESKIRILIDKLEQLLRYYNLDIQVWPFTFDFDKVPLNKPYHQNLTKFKLKEKLYIGIRALEDYCDTIDLNGTISGFVTQIHDKWVKENKYWNHDEFDLFVHLIDKDLIIIEPPKVQTLQAIEDVQLYPHTNFSNEINVNLVRANSTASEYRFIETNQALDQLLD